MTGYLDVLTDSPRKPRIFRADVLTVATFVLAVGLGATAAGADISGGLGGIGGGLGAGLGGGGSDVGGTSFGGGAGASASLGLGGGGAGVGAGTSFGGGGTGGGSTGGSTGGGTGIGVGVGVGIGGGTGTGPGTVPGSGPGIGLGFARLAADGVAANTPIRTIPVSGRMRCAKDGNANVYNGMAVLDRSGRMLGWVHDTKLNPDLTIAELRFESTGKKCLCLVGGSYTPGEGHVAVDMDGSRLASK